MDKSHFGGGVTMVELKVEHPLQKADATFDYGLIKHWAEDENGKKYIIKKEGSDEEYEEAVDIYPCPYTYIVTDKIAETENQEE